MGPMVKLALASLGLAIVATIMVVALWNWPQYAIPFLIGGLVNSIANSIFNRKK